MANDPDVHTAIVYQLIPPFELFWRVTESSERRVISVQALRRANFQRFAQKPEVGQHRTKVDRSVEVVDEFRTDAGL